MTTIALTTLAVAAAAAGLAALGRRIRPRGEHGIALQTVIIMVVLLVIAGGVATVLLARGGETVAQLQETAAAPITSSNCTITEMAGVTGVSKPGAGATPPHCLFTGSADPLLTREICVVRGGVHVLDTAGFAHTCTINY